MGLFRKFFSIGSRKSKKRSAVDPCTESLPPVQKHLKLCINDVAEAEVSRLLRSSSGRFSTESQVGLSPLPPLRKLSRNRSSLLVDHVFTHEAHPIDTIIPHPKSSSTTIASVSARSTYSVIIRSRTVHSRTVFPNAYPAMDESFTPKRALTDSARRRSKSVPITPRDKSRLLLLRQDPSVASLLDHYDDQGHLNSALFSNTPSPRKEGCVQRRRTGSTLRQLLGHPSSPELRSSTEGDISWAERFLGSAFNTLSCPPEADETLSETDGNSSVSSIGPRTPADTHFTHTRFIDDKTALSIECDTSATNHPTFSSLEVELSASTDHTHSQTPNSPNGNTMTPQRASQIFGFLGDKMRTCDGPVSRLPQLKMATPNCRRFSADYFNSDTKDPQIPLPHRGNTYTFQPTSPTSHRRSSLTSDTSESPPSPAAAVSLLPPPEESHIFSQAVISQHTGQSSRGPRGPRFPCKIPSRQNTGPLSVPCDLNESQPVTEQPMSTQLILGEKSSTEDEHITVTGSRSREMHSQIPKLRTASGSSSSSTELKHDLTINSPCRHPAALQPGVQRSRPTVTAAGLLTGMAPHGEENDVLSRLPQPVTPVRPFGVHSHHLREPPSPVSSSELSPVAKQMMANVRQQRMHARQRERQTGRLGSSQSRIRY